MMYVHSSEFSILLENSKIEHCFTRKIAVTFIVRMKMNIHSFCEVQAKGVSSNEFFL